MLDWCMFQRKFKVGSHLRTPCVFVACLVACATFVQAQSEHSRWTAEASHVTIIRDDWGIAHVHGKSDADAVFGMIYAQCEDDFHAWKPTT